MLVTFSITSFFEYLSMQIPIILIEGLRKIVKDFREK